MSFNFLQNANNIISQQMNYIKGIQGGGPIANFINSSSSSSSTATPPPQTPYPYPYFPISISQNIPQGFPLSYGPDMYGGGQPSSALFQQMFFMINFLNQMLGQSGGLSSGLGDITSTTPTLPDLTYSTTPQTPTSGAALTLIQDLVKKNTYENDATACPDPDGDGFVTSQEDLERMKKGITNCSFNEDQLQQAFQDFLLQGGADDSKKMDEALSLFDKAQTEGYVNYQNLLSPGFLRGMRQERRDQLVNYIGSKDVARENGVPQTKIANFLIRALDPSSPQSLQDFGKGVLKQYVCNYVLDGGQDTPNRTATKNLLRLLGFQFNPDNSLKPDSQQPFPVGVPEPPPPGP